MSPSSRRLAAGASVIALVLAASACTASKREAASPSASSAPTTSGLAARCGLRGAADGVATLCADTAKATPAPEGYVTESYRPAEQIKAGLMLEYAPDTLAADGSMLAYAYAQMPSESEALPPGHPQVGLVTKDGFAPFERETKADQAFGVVRFARSGDTAAWLEEASSAEEASGMWQVFSAQGGKVTLVASQPDVKNVSTMPLDATDPGPAIAGDRVEWRTGVETIESSELDSGEVQAGSVLLSAPLGGGKVSAREFDAGLANRDADGTHYFVADTGDDGTYQITAQSAEGKDSVVFTGTLGAADTVDPPWVRHGTVVWVVQSYPDAVEGADGAADDGAMQDGGADGAADDGGADGAADEGAMQDGGAADEGAMQDGGAADDGAMQDGGAAEGAAQDGSAGGSGEGSGKQAEVGTETQTGTGMAQGASSAIFAYTPAAKRLVRIQTADPSLSGQYVSVGKDLLGWGGDNDPQQYIADLTTGELLTIGQCPGCAQVALSDGKALYWTEPSEADPDLPVSVIGTLR